MIFLHTPKDNKTVYWVQEDYKLLVYVDFVYVSYSY